jgi:predicted HAD superfamily Cof-like phosphohydrolase
VKQSQIEINWSKPRADEHFQFSFAQGMTTFQRVEVFHQNMKLPFNHSPVTPTVSDRLLRGQLMLEEFVEFIEKGLGLEIHYDGAKINFDSAALELVHPEGRKYCPVETLDGICDMKVIADGTGVAFGLPVDQGDWEIFCSNMSKLDSEGNPIINDGIKRPDLPVGKLLKSEEYIPANLVRVIVEAQPDETAQATYEWLHQHGEIE